MTPKRNEKGQALVLIALAAVGLFALAALAIDGSRVYSDKRHAQNAADTSALAGALAYTRASDADKADEAMILYIITTAAQERSTTNSYDNDGNSNQVDIAIADVPDGECPGDTDGKDITVKITSYVNTTFARILGREQVTNAVTATARACGYYETPPFNGNPIVGLNNANDLTKECGIDTGNGDWYITGGGMFSNGCAKSHKIVDLEDGDCIASVGDVDGFPGLCMSENPKSYEYPEDVDSMMPPNPCDGTPGDIGIFAPVGTTTFNNGVYCITQFDNLDKKDIVLNNATLYVTDTSFNLQFTGQGGFSGTATRKGTYPGSKDYHGYFIIVKRASTPCTKFTTGPQSLLIRGNSGQDIWGTILAPSACIDLRGTSDGHAMHSQVIGYTVSSNGDATVTVNYDPDDNPKVPIYPTITQWK